MHISTLAEQTFRLHECLGDWRGILAAAMVHHYHCGVRVKSNLSDDRASRIFAMLRGARGMDDAERWQHALFFAMTPQQRCHFSLKTARSALSLRRSTSSK